MGRGQRPPVPPIPTEPESCQEVSSIKMLHTRYPGSLVRRFSIGMYSDCVRPYLWPGRARQPAACLVAQAAPSGAVRRLALRGVLGGDRDTRVTQVSPVIAYAHLFESTL